MPDQPDPISGGKGESGGLQDQLDAAARQTQTAQRAAGFTAIDIGRALDGAGDTSAILSGALVRAQSASEASAAALRLLLALGANRPAGGPSAAIAADCLTEADLARPEAVAFLTALEAAAAAGAALDRALGWVNDAGDVVGYGETLGAMVAELQARSQGTAGGK